MARKENYPIPDPGEIIPWYKFCTVTSELEVRVFQVREATHTNAVFVDLDTGEEVSLAGLHEEPWGAFNPKFLKVRIMRWYDRRLEEWQTSINELADKKEEMDKLIDRLAAEA